MVSAGFFVTVIRLSPAMVNQQLLIRHIPLSS